MPRPPLVQLPRRCIGPDCGTVFTPARSTHEVRTGTKLGAHGVISTQFFCSKRCRTAYSDRARPALTDDPFAGVRPTEAATPPELRRCADCELPIISARRCRACTVAAAVARAFAAAALGAKRAKRLRVRAALDLDTLPVLE